MKNASPSILNSLAFTTLHVFPLSTQSNSLVHSFTRSLAHSLTCSDLAWPLGKKGRWCLRALRLPGLVGLLQDLGSSRHLTVALDSEAPGLRSHATRLPDGVADEARHQSGDCPVVVLLTADLVHVPSTVDLPHVRRPSRRRSTGIRPGLQHTSSGSAATPSHFRTISFLSRSSSSSLTKRSRSTQICRACVSSKQTTFRDAFQHMVHTMQRLA